jgi:hypothetical protein
VKVKQETGKKWKNEKKLKKSGREFLFHYFNMGKSNLVFHTVSDNSWRLIISSGVLRIVAASLLQNSASTHLIREFLAALPVK